MTTTYSVTALRHQNITITVEADDEDDAMTTAEGYLHGTSSAQILRVETVDAMTEVIGVEATS